MQNGESGLDRPLSVTNRKALAPGWHSPHPTEPPLKHLITFLPLGRAMVLGSFQTIQTLINKTLRVRTWFVFIFEKRRDQSRKGSVWFKSKVVVLSYQVHKAVKWLVLNEYAMHNIYEWHSKTCASHTDLNKLHSFRFKTKIRFGCTFMYYMQVLSVPLLCNEGIVNIQVLCSIPLAWTWRCCQWYCNAFIFKLKEHWSLA